LINIQPKTKYIGRKIEYLPSCHSTNDYALELIKKTVIENGTIVITDNQTGGRGQRGNSWESQAGKNITCTIIYKPEQIKAANQFLLNILLSTSIFKTVSSYGVKDLKIKWPNDIYAGKKKLGGVLIESMLLGSNIENSIIGIGLNINQEHFQMEGPTSLRNIIGKELSKDLILVKLLECFEENIEIFKKEGIDQFKIEYLKNLFQKGEWCLYEDDEGEFKGRIVGITAIGEILIEKDLGLKKYGMKEFRYIL
jgi:BirA family transcriptional regulator, biotin operon repressor / biotin---[acetyl-CoA-carboxylase] ligase